MENNLIQQLITILEQRLKNVNAERRAEGLAELERPVITLLGQFALFADPFASENFDQRATRDLVALLDGDWLFRSILKETLKTLHLEYDDHSTEIWIPEEAQCNTIYESSYIALRAYDPLSIIVSKAIKAPAKNKFIVRQALLLYGDKLIRLIRKYGGDIEFFVSDNENS